MENKFTWNTSEIYSDVSAWEKDFNELKDNIDFSEFKGKLGEKKDFLACMKKQEQVCRKLDKLGVYAAMKHDENTADSVYDGLNNKINGLYASVNAAIAFVMPELTVLSNEKLNEYINDKDLVDYDYFLKTVLKGKDYVLSEKEEKILAESGDVLSSFRDIFTKLDNADINFGFVKSGCKKIPLTHGSYGLIIHGENRKLRKNAFKQYYKTYINLINTIAATYNANVKKTVFESKIRNYNSALSCALCQEDVPEIVYHTLIKTVNEALPTLHKYMAEKKKTVKLKEMHMYDVHVPVVKNAELKLDYLEAYDLVLEGLSVLGEEYVELLKTARDNRWIDVYEKEGKRNGAYSVAVYDTHPYVLLNYQKTTHDVFTIAHEMGHSIHSYFSNKNLCFAKADYKIFVAEVASTVNEVLLLKHLLKTASDNTLKKYLLSYLIEMIRTTLFRQVQFSEFEEFAHKSVENGVPLTKDLMCDFYLELNKKYFGDAVISDKEISYEWARIPHFYRPFYVYKYATGIISALAIADRILTEGKPAVDDYFRFLSSGGSDSPVELLKIAGVDLTSETPYKSAFKTFGDALEEFIKL